MTEAFVFRNDRLYCEDTPVEEIVAAYGTPLYVYSKRSLTERFRALDAAFAPVDHLIAYSVKANGNLAILRLLRLEGAGADVVSGGELFRARLAGIPAERIVFGGVGKTVAELAAGLDAGVYGFNVESRGELLALNDLAVTMGVRAPIALRINPDIETPTPHRYTRTGHATTKFGIPADQAMPLYREAARLPGIRVRGIDVHIGSQIVDPAPYQEALLHVLELVDSLRRDGIELEYLDLGGGFGVGYDDSGEEPDPADFAAVVLPHVAASRLKLILEPGRFIAGPSGVLLTRVLYVKEMGGKTFVVGDAGMNDLIRPSHYEGYHHIDPVAREAGRDLIRADVVGPVCETGDFLALDRTLPRPRAGELLAVRTAGAYGFVMASTYNARPRPAEVLVDGDTFRLVRRRESYDDLVRGEIELLEDAPAPNDGSRNL
ncbi:MAG TPA: diaminopimelate decarboxylase [Longimicrobiales bacterium]|nr:diaminopimelate decarboxylase [Longimicrobiales bacterium]